MTDAPRWTRLEHDERRRQIIAAGRVLFSQSHYSAVAMRDIAAAAGVARGLLHHYFASKHELYLEVVRDMLRAPSFPVGVGDGQTPDVVWETSVDGWLDFIQDNRETWLHAIRAGETGYDPALRVVIDEASEVFAERVLEALGLDRCGASPELRAVVRGYGGLAQEATREWLERGRLTRAQVRVLLVGTMPLIARELLPQVLAAGAPDQSAAGAEARITSSSSSP
jgi:AcrR family transcriptional regulator